VLMCAVRAWELLRYDVWPCVLCDTQTVTQCVCTATRTAIRRYMRAVMPCAVRACTHCTRMFCAVSRSLRLARPSRL